MPLRAIISDDESAIRGPWNLPVTYAAKIIVKRMFRGDKDRFKAEAVIVEGLGNPKICVSRPKIGDTRIFFADQIDFEDFKFPAENLTHFRLRSSILRLTLENLQFLWTDAKTRARNASTNSGRTFLKKNGPTPASFSFIFGPFKQIIQFLQQIKVKKCPNVHPVYSTGIWYQDLSNRSCHPLPLDQGSCPSGRT